MVSCEKWEVISLLVRTRRQSPTVTVAHSKRRMRAWWWCSPRSWWFKSWMRLFLGRWKMRRSASDEGEGDEDRYWADGDLHQRKEKGRRSSWFWSLMKGEWDEGAVRFLQGEQEVLMSEEWMVVRLMVNEREQGSRCGRQRRAFTQTKKTLHGLRAKMVVLGRKMPTLTHQIHLYSENNNI